MTDTERTEVAEEVLNRFVSYAKIYTTSDESLAEEKTPSTENQWELLHLLETELKELGVHDIFLDDHGYLIARVPGNLPEGSTAPCIGFMAHVDTNGDAPGENVHPQILRNYDGSVIHLKDGIVLDPHEYPLLSRYKGETIVSSDGTTLLGADDKAGIAEIMTALAWLLHHPDQPRGPLEIIFTPDEETGTGMDRFPVDRLESSCCYTLDGGEEGEVESECYYAAKAEVTFSGRVIHPGSARGKLVNATTMAATYISMLPRNESPEATDERYGNYWPHRVSGGLESADLTVFYRTFDREDLDRRTEALNAFARAVEASFPGGKVDVETKIQYLNMREELDKHPKVVETLRQAVRMTGIEPLERPIRGGTDGARLTAMGIPTPNVFAGGVNFHSRSEWVALPAMLRSVDVILNLVKLWAKEE